MINRSTSQPVFLHPDRPIRQQSYLAKGLNMNEILTGGQRNQPNSHFIDSLQRFKKDYASYDKQERQRERQKRIKILEERKNQQIQREQRIRRNQHQFDQQNMNKINQSRYLCEIGLKKTGFSNGMPMNPITLQYHQNPFGYQQKYNDEQQKLKRLVRAHHLQNASTSGYNLINGQNLPTIQPLVPKNTEGRLQEKLGQFYRSRRLDPNVDLQLNPKNMLPKYVGQVDHYNQSPIKTQKWDENDVQFETAYQSHYNKTPHELMSQSRMDQEKYHLFMLEQSRNPFLQDGIYKSQLYEMRR